MARRPPVEKLEQLPITELIPYARNARTHSDVQVQQIAASIREFGFLNPVLIDEASTIIAGHGRVLAAHVLELDRVPCRRISNLTAGQKQAYVIADNQLAMNAGWDRELLGVELSDIITGDVPVELLGFDPDELKELLGVDEEEPPEDVPAQTDRAEELRDEWKTETGQLWTITGQQVHRLLCGDCTDADNVARLMDGAKASLLHADPPYGMGKEKDGVANDNLYREKLDAFQMEWWQAWRPHLPDNGSAYIWGTANNLWRLWYVGGLKDSERLTMRNEIVWDKTSGQGMESDQHRMFPTASERCLFFMLGEQGFNNNAENYWDGWEEIRSALEADCKDMGWGAEDIKRICGVGMYAHWFTKNQWTFIPEEHYRKLQAAARDHDAFKRDHDELKRDFYKTRAYFDNTHDNMTDVWKFTRVTGEDRHGHATPKPVAMTARAIKSSSEEGSGLVDPFLGSGTTMLAAEQLNRRCYGMEISPAYCAVILQRMTDAGCTCTLE